MKIELLTNFATGGRVAQVTTERGYSMTLVPKWEDMVDTDADLLRWLAELDGKVAADASENTGLADLVDQHQGVSH